MTQIATVHSSTLTVSLSLPRPTDEVLPGVLWGDVGAFPSPAYWTYLVYAARLLGDRPRYELGSSLVEEVSACLLGGHGIPATVGLAAFSALKSKGALDTTSKLPTEQALLEMLSEPLEVNSKSVRYRFAAQKSRYLHAALCFLQQHAAPQDPKELRNWLIGIPGIGLKTASWVVRNWTRSDEVAILDVHLMRVGKAIKLFPEHLTVERHYLALEELFLQLSRAMDVRASELDAVIWNEMASSPLSVKLLDEQLLARSEGLEFRMAPSYDRNSNAKQLRLLA